MFDAFLKIEGIDGESTDDKHDKWIELLSFGHTLDQPGADRMSSGGGASRERVNHGPFGVRKQMDAATPKIMDHLCRGAHIKKITIELCRAGGAKERYMEIVFESCMFTSVNSHGDGTGESALPEEELAWTYGKITWTYTQQQLADGTGGGQVSAGWDCTKNVAI